MQCSSEGPVQKHNRRRREILQKKEAAQKNPE
jgi:hypothetical protein